MNAIVESWKNTYELEDGRTLTIRFDTETLPATWHDPEEFEQSETTYDIDGSPCLWDDLPAEVTVAIVTQLEGSASVDRGTSS